jgi:hypothetical protein
MTIVSSKKYLKHLTDKRFVEALRELATDSKDIGIYLSQLEDDLEHAGIFVTRRVYSIFFAPENREKWTRYLQDEYLTTAQEAEEIMNKIDLLPASKRRARDTYWVLGRAGLGNLTNTEFPNQQLDVWEMSNGKNFRLHDYEGSIMSEPDSRKLERLLRIQDFQLAYELTRELAQKLSNVGIKGEFGERGIRPEDWAAYGPVKKTMQEFSDAYEGFKQKVLDVVKQEMAFTN